MHVFEMVVLIVLITSIASIINKRSRRRMQGFDQEIDGLEEKIKKIDALEERVQVLERIVTDRNFDLKQELNDLDRAS